MSDDYKTPDATDKDYEATFTILMPSNQKSSKKKCYH